MISIQTAASDRHSASKPARSGPLPPSGQSILGADQRNPLLTVYHDEEHQQLRVYYGFEIIKIVPNDTLARSHKMLLGRLDNSGLKLCSLCEIFTLDPKTLRHSGWARPISNKRTATQGLNSGFYLFIVARIHPC